MSSFCIHVLDVGHGDSIILELPNNNWGVIDCFKITNESEPPALTFLKARNVKRLKFVCLTHPHYDHYHGMLEILKHFAADGAQIEEFWDFGMDKDKLHVFKERCGSEKEFTELQRLYDFILDKVLNEGIPYLEAKQNTKCLDWNNIKIFSLAPIGHDTIKYIRSLGKDIRIDENLLSVVLVVTCGQTNVILGSDTKSWQDILGLWRKECVTSKGRKRGFDFVKVSHHGSREGNDNGLWKSFTVTDKSVAVISTGCKYNLPHKETITSITSSKVRLYSTNFRDFSKPTSPDSLERFQEKGFISQSILEALESSTLPAETFEIIAPYHGNCSITVHDNHECLVSTEYNRPPIT